jgi:hypothetical protein
MLRMKLGTGEEGRNKNSHCRRRRMVKLSAVGEGLQ